MRLVMNQSTKCEAATAVRNTTAHQVALDGADYTDAAEGIRQGLDDLAQGCGIPACQVFAALRAIERQAGLKLR